MAQQISRFKKLLTSAGGFRHAMNIWPPLLFAGVRITHISTDFRRVEVRLAKTPLTTNYFGTQYGGSMFSMTDAFWVIMLAHNLGPEYTVWDRRAEIEFCRPGHTVVTSRLVLTEDDVVRIRRDAADGKVLRWFENDVLDKHGEVVARVRKQVYVRRKPAQRE